jgi:hypothetical protein
MIDESLLSFLMKNGPILTCADGSMKNMGYIFGC